MMVELSLYHSEQCFFCHKVRHALSGLSVSVELRDISDKQHYQALRQGGGKTQVPCLRIDNAGEVHWLYESDDIVAYLKQQ